MVESIPFDFDALDLAENGPWAIAFAGILFGIGQCRAGSEEATKRVLEKIGKGEMDVRDLVEKGRLEAAARAAKEAEEKRLEEERRERVEARRLMAEKKLKEVEEIRNAEAAAGKKAERRLIEEQRIHAEWIAAEVEAERKKREEKKKERLSAFKPERM